MVDAPTGDDVFYDDPTINELQDEVAQLFGKQKALLVPTGTMANLVSLMVTCREKGDGAIIGDMSHLNMWERGNIAAAGSIMPITLQNQTDGTIDIDEIDWVCKDADPHH